MGRPDKSRALLEVTASRAELKEAVSGQKQKRKANALPTSWLTGKWCGHRERRKPDAQTYPCSGCAVADGG